MKTDLFFNNPLISVNDRQTTKIYVYDRLNQLIEIQNPNGNKTRHSYDFPGNRISKVGGKFNLDLDINYSYDLESRPKAVINKVSTTSMSYYADGKREKKETAFGYTNYIYNLAGKLVAEVDRNGTIVNTYEYDEWGNVRISNETMSNPFKYAGEVYDEETGLYYLGARYYNPAIGRFLNEDTVEGQIDNLLSMNSYVYCYNNPLYNGTALY